MAKGGNNQRSNGSRFTKSYNASNSFVTKVASRVSDYLGGWFGTPLKTSQNAGSTGTAPSRASGDTTEKSIFENPEARRSSFLTHRIFDDVDVLSSPAKRFKVSDNEKVDVEFPISPIPSTSGLFQNTINHTFDIPKREDFGASEPGPSSLRGEKFRHSNDGVPQTPSRATEVKANGTTDNHSDSSESTSGCSSLVPQSDRLSQSAYAGTSRKRNLDEKLKYARQLQQSRASLYLNRSIPVSDAPGVRKKPSFDVTAYGSPALDKSLLREKLINSPFYTGQTSYGGASAYRLSRNSFYSHKSPRSSSEKGGREGVPVQVKPSNLGSTEDLSNMSHTAKKILEALEQFSTPVNDAKRIPVSRSHVPLGTKRRRFEESSEARLRLSTPISPLNPNPGPTITGLNVPTVPDLLKLKRLERIQDSTAAARQVAIQKQEYNLPSENLREKKPGKIVTKLKNREKGVPLEKLEEVNLPKIPLPITTLPKFDFKLPEPQKPSEDKAEKPEENKKVKNFVFSPPTPVFVQELPKRTAQKNNFTFSKPLNANGKVDESERTAPSPLLSFMSSDAVAKLKRKPVSDVSFRTSISPNPTEVKIECRDIAAKETVSKTASDTWECSNCLIRNIKESKICQGCKTSADPNETMKAVDASSKASSPAVAEPKTLPTLGFGGKFKPPAGSWSCQECFVTNNASATKCIACESPKSPPKIPKETPKPVLPPPTQNGFGDMFKKQANQWECSVCMIRNKEEDKKCVACETPKPGAESEKAEPKFNFGAGSIGGGFKFGIDKAGVEAAGVKSAADSSTFKPKANGSQTEPTSTPPQFSAISTSVGVFTFGIPAPEKKKEEPEASKPATETSGNFLVTSTSGSSLQKDEARPEKSSEPKKLTETMNEKESNPSTPGPVKPFIFGSANKIPAAPVFGSTPEMRPPESEETKAPKFSFGTTANASTLETVSSSTTDFTFGQNKSTMSQSKAADSMSAKPPATFQFKPFASPEATALQPNSRAPTEENKSDSAVSTSGAIGSAAQSFAPSAIFNVPKSVFGTNQPPSVGVGFVAPNLTSSNSNAYFGSQAPSSFAASGFTPQPSPAPTAAGSFGGAPQTADKPESISGTPFGTGSQSFSGTSATFGSAVTPAQNPEPAKPFGSFGTNSAIPNFGSNSTPTQAPAPAFGQGFMQASNASEKSAVPAPFIFGSTAPTTTTAPSLPISAPGVFTFGAPKPESKPSFSFGQNTTPNFSFGSNAATNVFGGFGQTKPENSLGGQTSFGNSPGNVFGQSSAPAAFGSVPPKFDFGGSLNQQQDAAPSLFQFGAASAQPASAPAGPAAGPAFSLSVPQKFNFTGGQTTTFSATSDSEPASVMRRNRKMIKAVRRANRDPSRRP